MWSEIESARAKIFTNMLAGSQWTLCVNGVKRWFPRSYAAGELMFEHCEAVLVPLGGITVALSPSGHAHPTP